MRVEPLARFGGAPLLPHPPTRMTGGCVATPLCAPPAPHWPLRGLAPLRGCPALLARTAEDGGGRRYVLSLSRHALRGALVLIAQRRSGDTSTTHPARPGWSGPLPPEVGRDREGGPQVGPGTALAISRAATAARLLRPRRRGRRIRSAWHVAHIVRAVAAHTQPRKGFGAACGAPTD